MKVISSEFPCDGKREFTMGCECGKRNVTDEIEKHCQASARIEGGGKGSIFFLTPSLTERQNLNVFEVSKWLDYGPCIKSKNGIDWQGSVLV